MKLCATCALVVATMGVANADDQPFRLAVESVIVTPPVDSQTTLNAALATIDTGLARCADARGEATSSSLFWLELAKGRVAMVRVHGSGAAKLDACLGDALRAGVVAKAAAPLVAVGRIEVRRGEGALPAPKQETIPIVVAAHAASWQLTTQQLGFVAHGPVQLAKALDDASAAIAACAPKRGAKANPGEALAFLGGAAKAKAIVRSGMPAYDACLGAALDAHPLPTPDTAVWMRFSIHAPAEPLAPRRTARPGRDADRAAALRDTLTTAVRARKSQLQSCREVFPTAKITKVTVQLAGGIARISRAHTGSVDADACVRKEFGDLSLSGVKADDRIELEVELDPYAE